MVVAVIAAVLRVVEFLSGRPFNVDVLLPEHSVVSVPLGAENTAVSIAATSGTVSVSDLPTPALVAGIAAAAFLALTICIITACLIALAIASLRGQIFSRRNTALVVTAGLAGLIGFTLANLAQTMLANGALAHAIGDSYAGPVVEANPLVWILAAFVVAVVATAFSVGARIQRETEGLV